MTVCLAVYQTKDNLADSLSVSRFDSLSDKLQLSDSLSDSPDNIFVASFLPAILNLHVPRVIIAGKEHSIRHLKLRRAAYQHLGSLKDK